MSHLLFPSHSGVEEPSVLVFVFHPSKQTLLLLNAEVVALVAHSEKEVSGVPHWAPNHCLRL